MPEPAALTTRPLDTRGLLGAIAVCAIWGGNAVAVKFAVPDLPPLGCAGLRFVLGMPLVALVCLRARRPLWPSASLWPLVLLHAAITVLQIGSFNLGTSFSRAGRASVLINVHPLVVAPLAAWILHERLGKRGILGLLAAVAGVVVLLGRSFLEKAPTSPRELLGDAIVLLSGIIFGVQTIAQKLTFPRIAPTTLLFSQSISAIPLFLGLSLLLEGPAAFHFTPAAIGGVLYQGIAALGLCYSLWFWLLTHYPAGRLSTIAFLTPLFGIGFSRLFQGEPLTLSLVASALLVGLGIYLVASDRAGLTSATATSAADPRSPRDETPVRSR